MGTTSANHADLLYFLAPSVSAGQRPFISKIKGYAAGYSYNRGYVSLMSLWKFCCIESYTTDLYHFQSILESMPGILRRRWGIGKAVGKVDSFH
jgi:hypothetical protein